MALTRTGYLVSGLILLLFATVNAIALSIPSDSLLALAVRLFALNGYLALAIAAIMAPFLGKVARAFGRPFLKIHHPFAALGIALVTLHPVALAILRANPLVFLPSAGSPVMINLGRLALILLYIALVGSLLRTKVKRWRYLHALVYIVLIGGVIHANSLGTDLGNEVIRALYLLLAAAVVVALAVSIRAKIIRMRSRSVAPSP